MKSSNEQMVENTMKFLEEAGMICAKSSDSHVIAMGNFGPVDVWPTTGKWRTRKQARPGCSNVARKNIYDLVAEFKVGGV